MADPNSTRRGFLKRFRDLVDDLERCNDVDLHESLRLLDAKVRIPRPVVPVQLRLGDEDGFRLHMYPELVAKRNGRMRPNGHYLLLDPELYFSGIGGFLRLSPGDAITLGREDEHQRRLFGYPGLVDERHLRIKLSDKRLALRNKSRETDVCLAPLTGKDQIERLVVWRQQKLARLAELLGGGVQEPSNGDAMRLLQRVIALMQKEPYRLADERGRPGGLLVLPDRPAPVFVGDLHARTDNLLVLLTQNGFLEAIADGSAVLILLGDAVHPDEPGEEEQMDSSMLMMDLIFRLKLRFPERVFYLRGNHDGFDEEITKGGVPQGLLWERALHDRRGPKYKKAMAELYRLLPHVALSHRYVACHAGPPAGKVSRKALVEIRQHPKLQHQLTHRRLRRPQSPEGYSRGDVERFRRRLGLQPDAPLIVGHTPLGSDACLWLDAGGIPGHHVVFGAYSKWIGTLTRIGRHLMPMRFPVEPMTSILNQLVATGRGLRL